MQYFPSNSIKILLNSAIFDSSIFFGLFYFLRSFLFLFNFFRSILFRSFLLKNAFSEIIIKLGITVVINACMDIFWMLSISFFALISYLIGYCLSFAMTHNEPLLKPGAWITLPPNDAPMRNNIVTHRGVIIYSYYIYP